MTYQKYVPSQRGVGRPEEFTREEVHARIRNAIREGMSDRSAGIYAGVADRTVWEYRKRHGIPANSTRGRKVGTDGTTANLEKYRDAVENFDTAAWLMERSEVTESGCREWRRARMKSGYGIATVRRGGTLLAHRLAYWVFVAPLTDNRVVDHICQNRACIEPTHLRLLDRAQNSALAAPALSDTCRKGHLLSGDNSYVYIDTKGASHRICRTCRVAIDQRHKAKIRLAKPPTTDERSTR